MKRQVLVIGIILVLLGSIGVPRASAQSPVDEPILLCTHMSINIRRSDRSGYFDTFLNDQLIARTKLQVGPGRVDWPPNQVWRGTNTVRLEIFYAGARLADMVRTFTCDSGIVPPPTGVAPTATLPPLVPGDTPVPPAMGPAFLPSVWNAVARTDRPVPPTSPPPTARPTDEPELPPSTIEDGSPQLQRRGSWQVVRDDRASGGSYLVSSAPGDELELRFSGDHADLLRTTDPNGGSASVKIDDQSFGPLSSQFVETRWQVPFVFDHLGSGVHQLVLTTDSPGFSFDVFHAPSQFEASAAQREAEERINYYRSLVGMPTVRLNRAIDLAAQAHAEYDSRRAHREGHGETPGQAGFTGEDYGDRMAYFGYTEASWEAMLGGVDSPSLAIDGWMSMVFHRMPIMQPEGVDVGFGMYGEGFAGRTYVLDTGVLSDDGSASGKIYAYPTDGQTGVPTEWEGREGPDPFPGLPKPVGYPVSLHFSLSYALAGRVIKARPLSLDLGGALRSPAAAWDIQIATLTDGAGRSVPVYVRGPQSHDYLAMTPSVYVVAQRPMTPNTRYTAHIAGRDGSDRSFDRTWSFSTGSWLHQTTAMSRASHGARAPGRAHVAVQMN